MRVARPINRSAIMTTGKPIDRRADRWVCMHSFRQSYGQAVKRACNQTDRLTVSQPIIKTFTYTHTCRNVHLATGMYMIRQADTLIGVQNDLCGHAYGQAGRRPSMHTHAHARTRSHHKRMRACAHARAHIQSQPRTHACTTARTCTRLRTPDHAHARSCMDVHTPAFLHA